MEYDERHHDYRPRKVFRYSDSSSVRLKRASERLDAALRRVENMESYVTSRQYQTEQGVFPALKRGSLRRLVWTAAPAHRCVGDDVTTIFLFYLVICPIPSSVNTARCIPCTC